MFEATKQRLVNPLDILDAAKGIGSSVDAEIHTFRSHKKVEVQVGEALVNEAGSTGEIDGLQARVQLIIDNLHVTAPVVGVLETYDDVVELIPLPKDESYSWADVLFDVVYTAVDGPGTEEQIACATVSIPTRSHVYMLAIDCMSTIAENSRDPQYRYAVSLFITEDERLQDSIAARVSGTIQ